MGRRYVPPWSVASELNPALEWGMVVCMMGACVMRALFFLLDRGK